MTGNLVFVPARKKFGVYSRRPKPFTGLPTLEVYVPGFDCMCRLFGGEYLQHVTNDGVKRRFRYMLTDGYFWHPDKGCISRTIQGVKVQSLPVGLGAGLDCITFCD